MTTPEPDEAPDETSPESGSAPIAPASPPGRRLPAWLGTRLGMLLAALVVVTAATAGSVYWWLYRPDQLTGEAAQEDVLAAAKVGAEAVLTYAPESVDQNLEAAKSHLTGEFLRSYSEFADTVVRPAAKERGVKTEANVARAAISSMQPDRATVLVFVNQVTTSKDRPTPALATSSVMMTLTRAKGGWLISEFTPV